MKTIKILSQGGALALSLLACAVMAAVSPEEAGKLGTTLTPVGAELAGNADGSIPPWNGGLSATAGTVDANGFLADPFANEQPLFTITAANAEQYQDKLSAGQLAMFKRYPGSYKIPVYPTHRTASLPDKLYAAATVNASGRNAVRVFGINTGSGVSLASDKTLKSATADLPYLPLFDEQVAHVTQRTPPAALVRGSTRIATIPKLARRPRSSPRIESSSFGSVITARRAPPIALRAESRAASESPPPTSSTRWPTAMPAPLSLPA